MKRILLLTVISAMVLGGCGNSNSGEVVVATETATETENAPEKEEAGTEKTETASEQPETSAAFGLKDFEGFYYMTSIEEMNGFNFEHIYGYLFNGDGTGTFYGQDNIDITWNETEIHYADYSVNYEMEPDKLTVHEEVGDMVYEKLSGNLIRPVPYKITADAVPDGTYPAEIMANSISDEDGKHILSVGIYAVDLYTSADLDLVSAGDIIYVDKEFVMVDSIESDSDGCKNINGGLGAGGATLVPAKNPDYYVFDGYDDVMSYTFYGFASLPLSSDVKFTDSSDLVEGEKVYTGDEIKTAIDEITAVYALDEYNCRIVVENGEVAEINRYYVP